MLFSICPPKALAVLFLSVTALTLPVNAETATDNTTLDSPDNVVALRYSDTAAEIFWARTTTFGLRFEISRDGILLTNTDGVSYYDPSLSAENSPTYDITAIDKQGQRSSPASITVPTRNAATETLAPPADVTAQRYSDTAAEIFWSRSATFGLHYEVSRDGTLVVNTSGISFFDSSLAANDSPTYNIIAIDGQGHRSTPSSIVVPTRTPPTAALAAPSDVSAQRYSKTAAEIFWARPATAGLSYEISRNGTLLGNTHGVSYFDDTLTEATSTTYSITAIDGQGQRSSASSVTAPASHTTDPQPATALINLENYEQILQELIKLINGTPFYEVLDTEPDVTGFGITYISGSSDPVNDDVFGLGFLYDYICNAGGSLEMFVFTAPGSRRLTWENCVLEANTLNGILQHFNIGREGTGVTAREFTVETETLSSTLSGESGSSFFRGVPGRNRYWKTTSFDMLSSEGALAVRSYQLDATSAYYPPTGLKRSNLLVSFDVSAPWTAEQNIHVEVALQASLEANTIFTWQTGELVAVADDGSQMTLTPSDTNQRTFDIAISGLDGSMSRQWSDGFEIHCAYTSIESCSSF